MLHTLNVKLLFIWIFTNPYCKAAINKANESKTKGQVCNQGVCVLS